MEVRRVDEASDRVQEALAAYLDYLEMGGPKPDTDHLSRAERDELEELIGRRPHGRHNNAQTPPLVCCRHDALGHTPDLLLTFQVKGAGRGSDKAMGHLQDHIGASALGALSDRCSLNAIALAQRDLPAA
jgi:hypothetical protein